MSSIPNESCFQLSYPKASGGEGQGSESGGVTFCAGLGRSPSPLRRQIRRVNCRVRP